MNTIPQLKKDLISSYNSVMHDMDLVIEKCAGIYCSTEQNGDRWLKWDIQLSTIPENKFIEFADRMELKMSKKGHRGVKYDPRSMLYFKKYHEVDSHLQMIVPNIERSDSLRCIKKVLEGLNKSDTIDLLMNLVDTKLSTKEIDLMKELIDKLPQQ